LHNAKSRAPLNPTKYYLFVYAVFIGLNSSEHAFEDFLAQVVGLKAEFKEGGVFWVIISIQLGEKSKE